MQAADARAGRWFPAVALGVVLVAFVLVSAPRISAPFGDSDEGINGAVWATNSRALREAGPIDSRLGGRRLDGTEYATHPPYIVISTALAETIAGERSAASRAPAWLGSIAAVVLLYLLVRRAGSSPAVSAAAAGATAVTPMLFTYGFMLDTPVVSLPFGIAVLLAWHEQWKATEGGRGWHPLAAAAICVAAGLAGWQAAVLTGLAGVTLLARGMRGRRHAVHDALPFLVGGAIGVALSLSWTWWVYGDFSTLGDKFFRRSGESNTVGIDDMVSFQIPWIFQLLGLGIAGLGACIAALWDRRFRALAAMSLGIVLVYAIVFRQAAAGHQYWNYWTLIPTAVGFAWAFGKLSADVPARARGAVLAVAVAVLAAVNLAVLDDEALRYIDEGHEAAELVVATDYPAEQTTAPYIGPPYRPDAWLGYYTERAPVQVTSADRVPDGVIVELGWCDSTDPAADFCEEVLATHVADPDRAGSKPFPRVGDAALLLGPRGG